MQGRIGFIFTKRFADVLLVNVVRKNDAPVTERSSDQTNK